MSYFPGAGAVTFNDTFDAKALGAIGDGSSHPASTRFSTLAAAQAVYSFCTALTNELDALAIQLAINKAQTLTANQGGRVYIPEGIYQVDRELIYPCTVDGGAMRPTLLIEGASQWGTVLHSPTDLGAGTSMFKPSDPVNSSAHVIFRNFYMYGPNDRGTAGVGTPACQQSGITVVSNMQFDNIATRCFYAGFKVYGNHQSFRYCESRDNYYNLYYFNPYSRSSDSGNQYITCCDFTGPLFASIALSCNGVLDTGTIEQTHLGFGPYAIYREAPGSGQTVIPGGMNNMNFLDCSVEWLGNGMFYGENVQDSIIGCVWSGGGSTSFSDSSNDIQIHSRGRDSFVKVGTFGSNLFSGVDWSPAFTVMTTAVFNCSAFASNVFTNALSLLNPPSASVPAIVASQPYGNNAIDGVFRGNFLPLSSTLSAPGLVSPSGSLGAVQPMTSGGVVKGFATSACTAGAGALVAVLTEGNVSIPKTSGAAIAVGALVVASATTNGAVEQWGPSSTTQAIGVAAYVANPSDATVSVDLNLSLSPLKTTPTATAVPSSGTWQAGTIVINSAPTPTNSNTVILGWLRATTGSGNVAGTDWLEVSGTVPPAPSAAAPNTISNLQLWLKADAITGLADGAAVASWVDSSTGGHNATQATAGLQPKYRSTSAVVPLINGLPVVQFDGVGTFLDSAAATSNPATVIVVARHVTGSGAVDTLVGSNPAGGFSLNVHDSTATLEMDVDSVAAITSSALTSTTGPHIYAATFAYPGSASVIMDGVTLASASPPGGFFGSAIRIGATSSGNSVWRDVIAEVIYYSRVLTAYEMASVTLYLKNKYAIT